MCVGPGSVNELLPPTVGKTVHPRRKVSSRNLSYLITNCIVLSFIIIIYSVEFTASLCTYLSLQSRPIAQGSRVVSLARLSPKAIKENTDAAHSKDIPACTWTSDAGESTKLTWLTAMRN